MASPLRLNGPSRVADRGGRWQGWRSCRIARRTSPRGGGGGAGPAEDLPGAVEASARVAIGALAPRQRFDVEVVVVIRVVVGGQDDAEQPGVGELAVDGAQERAELGERLADAVPVVAEPLL